MNLNLPLALLIITCFMGLIYLIDIVWWSKQRLLHDADVAIQKTPFIIEQSRSLFFVFLFVLIFRSFVGQQFSVPTGSLEPTVIPGDILLVDQFSYGLRLPVWRTKIFNIGEPKRGDIVLFKWPVNPNYNYVKRLIGLPGDKISYLNKILYVNGKKAPQTFIADEKSKDESGQIVLVKKMQEQLNDVPHTIYVRPDRRAEDFKNLTVPEGMYFMMGDNRDDSDDGRYWGFVPERAIIGKARRIGVSWDSDKHRLRLSRFGRKL